MANNLNQSCLCSEASINTQGIALGELPPKSVKGWGGSRGAPQAFPHPSSHARVHQAVTGLCLL